MVAVATDLRRWHSEGPNDIRDGARVAEDVPAFIVACGALSVVMTDRIIGCPHEEGVDHEGSSCPLYPFWAGANAVRRRTRSVSLDEIVRRELADTEEGHAGIVGQGDRRGPVGEGLTVQRILNGVRAIAL